MRYLFIIPLGALASLITGQSFWLIAAFFYVLVAFFRLTLELW